MKITQLLTLLVFLAFSLTQCTAPQELVGYQAPTSKQIEKESNALARLTGMFEGYFSNSAYAASINDPHFDQEIMSRRIWKERTDARWVYLSWYKADLHTMPLTEVILQFNQIKPDTFTLQLHKLPVSLPFSVLWKENDPFRESSPKDLETLNGCLYKVARNHKNQFHVIPNKGYCDFNVGGSIRWADFDIILTPNSMTYFNTFFNAEREVSIKYEDNAFIRQDLNKLLLSKQIK